MSNSSGICVHQSLITTQSIMHCIKAGRGCAVMHEICICAGEQWRGLSLRGRPAAEGSLALERYALQNTLRVILIN